jgi:type IV secretory pathway component VirB8
MTLNKVQALSTHKVFREFEEYVDPNKNIKSPILLYKSYVKRSIKIHSVKINIVGDVAEGAVVEFAAFESHKGEVKTTNHRAYIDFMISDLQKVLKMQETFFFMVAHYVVEDI